MDLPIYTVLLGDGDTVNNPVTVSKDLKHSLTGWTVHVLHLVNT